MLIMLWVSSWPASVVLARTVQEFRLEDEYTGPSVLTELEQLHVESNSERSRHPYI